VQILRLAGDPLLRERIRRTASAAVGGRTWEAALDQLAGGYHIVLDAAGTGLDRKVA
jgi:hypothetical protein